MDAGTSTDTETEYHSLLCQKMKTLQQTGQFCDVKLQVGESIFSCHRIVLASVSEFFEKLFGENFKESKQEIIPIKNVDKSVFEKLLNSIYGDPLDIGDDIIPLVAACAYLQLPFFKDVCEQFVVSNIQNIDVLELFALPDLKFYKSLYKTVRKYVSTNFVDFSADVNQLGRVSFETLEEILLASELIVFNKRQLFDCCRMWLCHNPKDRAKFLFKLVELIQPTFVPSSAVVGLSSCNQKHLNDASCLKMVYNCMIDQAEENKIRQIDANSYEPMFFKENDNSDLEIVNYGNLLSKFYSTDWKFPVRFHSFENVEATVLNNYLYLSSGLVTNKKDPLVDPTGISFYGCNMETRQWMSLSPTGNISQDLITCNSKVYSYQNSYSDYQFFVYESCLNRWLALPPTKDPRQNAGVTSDGYCLYVVGGISQKAVGLSGANNIVELYDNRCKQWSCIIPTSSLYSIASASSRKKVLFINHKLCVICHSSRSLFVLDTRYNKWSKMWPIDFGELGFFSAVSEEVWYIDTTSGSIRTFEPNEFEEGVGVNPPTGRLKPIQIPRRMII